MLALLFILCHVLRSASAAQEVKPLCGELEATLRTDAGDAARIDGVLRHVEKDRERRIEIRRCTPGTIQIAAWAPNAGKPGVVVNLFNDRVVQMYLSGGVFVLEMAGSTNRVIVVQFATDQVNLVADLSTKTDAVIESDAERVRIKVQGYQTLVGYRTKDRVIDLPLATYYK